MNDRLEHKRMEETLLEREALYRALFDGSPDAILLANPETGIILDANPAASRLLARPHEGIVGLHQSKLHPPRREKYTRATFSHHVEVTDKQGKMLPVENTVLRPDGSEVPVEIRAQMVAIGRKKVLQGVFRDITDRKRVELALREGEERLRQAVRVSSIGIYDHDHLADTIYWSPQQREIYGCGPHEVITLAVFLARVHPEDRERIAVAVRRAHDPAGDGLFDVEHRIIRSDGEIRWLDTRSQTFFGESADGTRRPVRTVGAIRDITERRRTDEERQKLQAQFIQAQKMESVGRLAGGVAHDFNNMLSVIIGHVSFAMLQLDRDSPVQANLQSIQKAAECSADLTRQLLAFARKQTISPKVLDLNGTAEGLLKMLGRLIGEDISIEWIAAPDLWKVRIDPAQVDQVLANLLVNARDAISGKGRITIGTANVLLDEVFCAGHRGFVPGRYVMLSIKDDGCGMDGGTLAHIFEPFYTTKVIGQGTGLGLATVYGIVKQNHGFISVSSEPGKGTMFSIYLPPCDSDAVPVPLEGSEGSIKGGNETVLLVEDDLMVLEAVMLQLEHLGYTVLTANTPAGAARTAAEQAGGIHLLITDVAMPGMNGRELSRGLQSLYPHLKVLFISGYMSDTLAPQGVLEDDIHVLQKPFSLNSLAAKVREALEGKS
jgi:two-component system cell cycle sensor histidine kinase/response regulator CckA